MRLRLAVDGEAREVEVLPRRRALIVLIDGAAYRAEARETREGLRIRIGAHDFRIRFQGGGVEVDGDRHELFVGEVSEERAPAALHPGIGAAPVPVRPPMPGRIVRIPARSGMRVKRGQTLVVLEAMKMQNEIPAPADGVIQEVLVREGESVTGDRVLAVLEPS